MNKILLAIAFASIFGTKLTATGGNQEEKEIATAAERFKQRLNNGHSLVRVNSATKKITVVPYVASQKLSDEKTYRAQVNIKSHTSSCTIL